jgi:hypothetical protein
MGIDLRATLVKATGSSQAADAILNSTAKEVGVTWDQSSPMLAALALCKLGTRPEEVCSSLDWREFERFCSGLLKASNYEVMEDVRLRRPRAQIDIVALCPSHLISIDCKHWMRRHSNSVLHRFAQEQLVRSSLLRLNGPDKRPIFTAILSFSQPSGEFVDGVAVVPIRTLRDFLGSIESYSGLLRTV